MSLARRGLLLAASVATFAATGLALLCLAVWTEWMPPQLPHAGVPVFVLGILGVPALAALQVGRRLARRWRLVEGKAEPREWRRFLWPLALGYGLTALVGIPATQTRRDSWAVAEYKRLKASGSVRVWAGHPYIETYVAIPVLPALILSYHEYQLDGLYGFGGFELEVWYGVGVRSLGVLPLWLS